MNTKYKTIIVGDSNVGKSSILNVFLNKKIENKSTIGTEFASKFMEQYNFTLQIWDCAGQEKYRSLTKIYYRGTQVCIFVFDLNNPSSLDNIKTFWINNYLQSATQSIFILVGNKSDLPITIDYNIIWDLCKTYDMKYIEASATESKNINHIFDTASQLLLKKYDSLHISYNNDYLNDSINISTTSTYNPYSCC